MGLDDFMDLDTESTEQTNTEDTETTSELDDKPNFNEDGKRHGPLGYDSLEEYKQTAIKQLDWQRSLYKFNLPIFPHIEVESKYSEMERYTAFKEKQIVTCASKQRMRLCDIPRDVIMLDTGEVEKEKCIDVLNKRFNAEVTPGTDVFLYFFTKTRHIGKMAIADSITDDWNLKNKDELLKSIYNESYTQQFRKSDEVDDKLKHIDHITPW